jgi:hypothetical protein
MTPADARSRANAGDPAAPAWWHNLRRAMPVRAHAALFALALSACASHEGPSSTVYTPSEPRAEVTVAVASVQLLEDCPDPPEPGAAEAPAADQAPAAARSMPAPGPTQPGAALMRKAGPGGGSPPCIQSTIQLSFNNTGAAPGKLQIMAVRLLDAADKRELGTLQSRKPQLWSDDAGYKPWNETVDDGANIKAAYRLADPDWSQVQSKLPGGTILYTRPFILELDVTVDGVVQTVRSPEFVRQEGHNMIVT